MKINNMEEEELESIVQTMIDNEEPEENIKLAIEEYDRQGKPTPTTPDAVVEETIASDPIIPENGESKPDDILLGLEKIKDVREIDKRIKKITTTAEGESYELGPLDSPKRINQYNKLISRRNDIINETFKLGRIQEYQKKDFDPFSPTKIPRGQIQESGEAKLAFVPFMVDDEVVGLTLEPLQLREVVVTAEQYKEREKKIQREAYQNFLNKTKISIEPLTFKEFKEQKRKEGTITEVKSMPYAGLNIFQSFENIGTYLSQNSNQLAMEKEYYRDKYEKYLSFVKNKKIKINREIPGFGENAYGNLANFFLQVGGTDDRLLYGLAQLAVEIPDDAYKNILGEELGTELKSRAVKNFLKINEKIDYVNSLTLDTVTFLDTALTGGEKSPISTTGLSAFVTAMSQFAATGVTAIPTRGVTIFTDTFASVAKDYNEAQARMKGISFEELAERGETEFIIPAIATLGIFTLEKAGLKGITSKLKKLPPSALKIFYQIINGGSQEGATEYLQGLIEVFNVSLGEGKTMNEALDDVIEALTSPDSLNNFLSGFAGGGGIILGGASTKTLGAMRTPKENKRVSNLINQLNNLEDGKFRKNLKANDIAQINTAQEEIRSELKNIVLKSNELAGQLTDSQVKTVNEAYDFLTTSATQINQIKASNKYTNIEKANLINTINQKRKLSSDIIYNIRTQAEKLEQQVFNIKDLSKFVKGVKIVEAENDAKAKEFAKNNKLEEKAAYEQGYIYQNPETNEQTIIINKETAQNQQAVNVAAHEFLHAILYSTIKNNPKAAENLGAALLFEINKIDIKQVQDSNFRKRLKTYKNKGRAVQLEESITLFSDALVTGDIVFKEGLGTEIGDKIRRLKQKFGIKIKFDTGRDVFNFIKDYNKNIKEGKLNLSFIEGAKKGFEGKLIPTEKIKTDEQIIKESKSQEASNKVQKIYEEQGRAGAYDIINEFKPITTKIARKRREAPNYNEQDLISEIELGKGGIIDLIDSYNPELGVPLAAHINKNLPLRAIAASKRILGEQFTQDVTVLRDVAVQQETIIKEELQERKAAEEIKSLRKLINLPDNIVSQVKDAVIKTFGTRLPSPESPKFKLALQKAFRIELKKPIAKFTGKQNEYRNFLDKNFKSIYNKLTINTLAKRFPQFVEPVIDPKTGKQAREKTAQGNKIFKKKNITKEEFINYFLGENVGRSTQGTRKTAIAEAVAEEIAFDATMEVLRNPSVTERYLQISELIESPLPENFKSIIAKQIERGEDFKFAKSLVNQSNLSAQELAKLLKNKSLLEIAKGDPQIAEVIKDEAFIRSFPETFKKIILPAYKTAINNAENENIQAELGIDFVKLFSRPLRTFSYKKSAIKGQFAKNENIFNLLKNILPENLIAKNNFELREVANGKSIFYNNNKVEDLVDITQPEVRQRLINKRIDKEAVTKQNNLALQEVKKVIFELGESNPGLALSILKLMQGDNRSIFR
jgi:hypothetical protein